MSRKKGKRVYDDKLPSTHKGETVEEYLARGGKIKVIPPGEESEEFKAGMKSFDKMRQKDW